MLPAAPSARRVSTLNRSEAVRHVVRPPVPEPVPVLDPVALGEADPEGPADCDPLALPAGEPTALGLPEWQAVASTMTVAVMTTGRAARM